MFFSANLVTVLSFFFNLSFFNYLALSVPALGLYIDFFGEVLYFYCRGLLGNFRCFFLACYLAILLLNII